jgi:SAM-dependent methyltransferase
MDIEDLKSRKHEIIERWGPWTAHNIKLCDGLYTIGGEVVGDDFRLRRIMQMIADCSQVPIEELTVLDLGCLEGLFAIELALHGAKVTAIEGRIANIEKARFAKEALSLGNVDFVLDDVRNLRRETYGHFDIVLCLGILYHLDVPDVFAFMRSVAGVCDRLLVIDTQVSVEAKDSCVYDGRTYWGKTYREFFLNPTAEEKASSLWASLDNEKSFWFTRASLYNLLRHMGFSSIYECHSPPLVQSWYDRVTLLAIKGGKVDLLSSPLAKSLPDDDHHEGKSFISPAQTRWFDYARLANTLYKRTRKRLASRHEQ